MTVDRTERVVERTLSRRRRLNVHPRSTPAPAPARTLADLYRHHRRARHTPSTSARGAGATLLRARATSAGGAQPGRPPSPSPGSDRWPIGTALLVALLAGAALGMGLALLSVLVPGLLPAFG